MLKRRNMTEKTALFRDIPAEFWLRVITMLLVLIGGIGGYFGNRLITSIDNMQKTINIMGNSLNSAITVGKVDHERLNRVETDVKYLQINVQKNTDLLAGHLKEK
jgi:hypothetical protein